MLVAQQPGTGGLGVDNLMPLLAAIFPVPERPGAPVFLKRLVMLGRSGGEGDGVAGSAGHALGKPTAVRGAPAANFWRLEVGGMLRWTRTQSGHRPMMTRAGANGNCEEQLESAAAGGGRGLPGHPPR